MKDLKQNTKVNWVTRYANWQSNTVEGVVFSMAIDASLIALLLIDIYLELA